METISISEWDGMLRSAADRMPEQERYLCGLDAVVGDGDHGVTIKRGFASLGAALTGGGEAAERLEKGAKAMMAAMGGAIGPIYGTLFRECAKGLAGKAEVSVGDFAGMLENAWSRIQILGDVREGQKTMGDALAPASRALRRAAEEGVSFPAALDKAAEAARTGAEETAGMQASKGRARFLKEKSLGHPDAGAVSFSLWLGFCAAYFRGKDGTDK